MSISEVAFTFGCVGWLALVHDIRKDVGISDVGGHKIKGKALAYAGVVSKEVYV